MNLRIALLTTRLITGLVLPTRSRLSGRVSAVEGPVQKRLTIWSILSGFTVACSLPFALGKLGESGLGLAAGPLSLAAYTLDGRLSPWVVSALGGFVIWAKRREMWAEMQRKPTLPFACLGLILLAAQPAILFWLPGSSGAVLGLLIGPLGWSCLLLGRGSAAPLTALAALAVVLVYPEFVERHIEGLYAGTVLGPVTWALRAIQYPFAVSDLSIFLTMPSGNSMWLSVGATCAGPTTMALFLGFYLLMMWYRPLPRRKAFEMLLLGVTGTWLQNVIRVTSVIVIGRNFGEAAMWSAHEYLSYFIFPLWYLVFAVLYLSQAGGDGEEVRFRPAAIVDGVHSAARRNDGS